MRQSTVNMNTEGGTLSEEISRLKELVYELSRQVTESRILLDMYYRKAEERQQLENQRKALLKGPEAARQLGISPATLIKMRTEGRIAAVYVGKTWRYEQEVIDNYKNRYGVGNHRAGNNNKINQIC